MTRQDFREALQAACGVELHPYHLGRLCERIDADGEAGGRVSYGNFIRSEVGDLLAPAATAPAVRAVSRGASARVTTPRLDAKRLHMMQRTGQLATAAPQPLSQPLCRAVAHSWRKMRKALKQIDMEYGAGSAATARSVSRWRGRVPIRDFEQTMKKHSAALTERDRVQLIARLSDHRGDVAYNDFFRLALRNAPRSAR